MALRAVTPTKIEKRLKVLFYGVSGVGKSFASTQFPKPYFIDTERGSENDEYIDNLTKSGGKILQTSDFDELLIEVTSLLKEKHEYKTLVIDSLTILYNDLIQRYEVLYGTKFARHYNEANKKMKHLLNLLLRLDMNVIVTAHSKTEHSQEMTVLGRTFDCYKGLDYLFDLVIEVERRGDDSIGIVKKTRIKSFPRGEQFLFSYDVISARYGKNILEKNSIPEILCSPEQVLEVKKLIELYRISQETYTKWLNKARAETFEEMREEDINKIINHLQSKIKGETE